jgi:MFS transporter, DHA1 family, multidrug resistance protein
MPPLTLLMFSWSFVQSNAIALGLTNHPQIAGSASALLGVSQFAFGAVMAPLVGIGGANTALPMAIVVASCGIAAALALKGLVGSWQGPQITAASVEAQILP